jgi:hypothetical protein
MVVVDGTLAPSTRSLVWMSVDTGIGKGSGHKLMDRCLIGMPGQGARIAVGSGQLAEVPRHDMLRRDLRDDVVNINPPYGCRPSGRCPRSLLAAQPDDQTIIEAQEPQGLRDVPLGGEGLHARQELGPCKEARSPRKNWHRITCYENGSTCF